MSDVHENPAAIESESMQSVSVNHLSFMDAVMPVQADQLASPADNSQQYCSAEGQPGADGRYYMNDTLDGTPRRVDAPIGTAQHVLELIEHRNFQNRDGSLTRAAEDSINAFMNSRRFWHTMAGRAEQLQDYLRERTDSPRLSVEYQPYTLTDNSLTGHPRPAAVILTLGGRRHTVLLGR